MKLKSNFFLGLGVGLAMSFSTFMFVNANSESGLEQDQSIAELNEVDPIKGGFITTQEAAPLIAAYSSNFLERYNLPSGTTTGGFVGKSQLRDVAALFGSDEYIKFNYYMEEAADGTPQIGIIFYANETAANVLRTGPASFCPSQCDYPK